MDKEKYIEVISLHKKFKNINAVNGLDLNVFKGDIYGFLGPNGAGKSTTIRMLLSLIKSDSGEIQIFGKKIPDNKIKILKRIGALIEKPSFFQYLSAYKNLEIISKYAGININKNKILEILEIVGLKERYNSKVRTFSQGMKQRLGIAQSLLGNPELLILDEPVNGLDPQGTRDIRLLIENLNRERQITVLISSHLLSEIEMIANRMIIINKGKHIVEGEVKNLLHSESLNVRFEVNNPDLAKQVISQMCKQDLKIDNEDKAIIVSLNKNQVSNINKALVENNIEVYSIATSRPLEELFIKLTDNN